MLVSDQEAVAFLNGPHTVRDGVLVAASFEQSMHSAAPTVTMVFEKVTNENSRTVTLQFHEVTEFGFLYLSDHSWRKIAFFKCLQTDRGDFFVSLDPYDERESFVSEKDGDFVRAKHFEVTINPIPSGPI